MDETLITETPEVKEKHQPKLHDYRLVYIGVMMVIASLLGWVSDIGTLLIISGMQLIGFFIIWLIMYFGYKKQIRELNEMQEHFQNINKTKNEKEGTDNENK